MLKKTIFSIISLSSFLFCVHAQVIHKPAELLKIIKDSKLSYSTGQLYIDIEPKDYSNILNETNIYHEDSEEHIIVKKMFLIKEAQAEWDVAEKSFLRDSNYKEARKHYKNVLDIQSDYYPAKIQIGRTYDKEEDFEKAESYYKQAISKNYVDYTPHWLIAEAYFKERNYEDAINEITLAAILNRNDRRILESMNEIYESAHLKYDDWTFTPQYKLFKGQKENVIEVLSKEDWNGYAIGKAIWDYEPGYSESQGEKPGISSVIQEKECLLNLLASQDESKKKNKDKGILNLQKAQEYKMMDSFIFYEELLPQQPSLVFQLPNNVIKGMKNYVMMAHGGQKPK